MEKFVVVVGGELFNKGAQALSFTVIDNIKKKHPEAKIVMLSSMDYKRSKEELENYNFEVLPFSIDMKLQLLGGLYKPLGSLISLRKNAPENMNIRVKYILQNSIMFIDISGFALSSQRGNIASMQYLFNLKVASKFGIPTYLFPQSFGPFNYGKLTTIMKSQIKKELLKAEKIYAREKDGIAKLKELGIYDVEKSNDIVLQHKKEYTLSNIYINPPQMEQIEIKRNAVGIIPNVKIIKHGNEDKIFELYYSYIKLLLKFNKKIYILRHSHEDSIVMNRIKSEFQDNKNIIYLDQDYSCIQIDDIMGNFDYIIGSRYHSIVHSYKNFTPAIVIGWAVKYEELLSTFEQENYSLDVRKEIDLEKAVNTLNIMEMNYSNEREKIKKIYNGKIDDKVFTTI
ncbi:MAG: polysaccharide pyruvyl transferase family protein [Niallia nealsonii]|nr:polysaccharide pyruvyl transferase family protein [Niallia nealsonii]